MNMARRLVPVFTTLLLAAAAVAAAAPATAPERTGVMPTDLKWMPAPALPKGVQIAVLRGDPFAEGFATVRLKIPPHTTIAPHWHPTIESFTVLKGELFVGMGDRVDKARAQSLPSMAFASMPALHHHYAYTGNEAAIIDVSFYGPFQIHYVNPADAPAAH